MVGRVNSELRPRPGPPGRHLHWHLVRRRRRLLRAGGVAALFAVVGPGVLAGLSDDDPAGIAAYSILGAKFGYRLLWVARCVDDRADRLSRAGRPHGRCHGEGPSRPGSRPLRPARRDRRADRVGRCESRQAVRRVRRRRDRARSARRRQPLRQRPVGRDRRLAAHPAGLVSPRRARPARALKRLHRLRRLGLARPIRTGVPPRAAWSCPACR